MKIAKIWTEYQYEPLGLDEPSPRFSWQYDGACSGQMQEKYRICVKNSRTKRTVWDSGVVYSRSMSGTVYEGEALCAITRYDVLLETWDDAGGYSIKKSFFETGLLNSSISAWDGAEWICAPRFTVKNRTRGVFRITSAFSMRGGAKRAGILFGADDYRLLDRTLNELGLEGANGILYEIAEESGAASLRIYRKGYSPSDTSAALAEFAIGSYVKESFHTLSVEVTGNCAVAYLDGMQIGERIILNPRGENDVLTYPRLNKIGFFAGEGGEVFFKNLSVANLRKPSATYIDERPGRNLNGKRSVFDERMQIKENCFVLSAGAVTADTSSTSIPMLRRRFLLEKEICSARLYITARGIYEAWINGKRITDRRLTPGVSQYDKRLHYQTYDVTKSLQAGENAIGVILASGWWSDAQTFTVRNYNYFGDKEALLCKLQIHFADGSSRTIVSDTENWRYYGEGPYEYAGLFMGEEYDARKGEIVRKFSFPDFCDAAWEKPVSYVPVPIESYDAGFARKWPAVNLQEPLLTGGYDAPVYAVRRRAAVARKKKEEGIYLYDFGQEMAGVPVIRFREKRGTRVYIRYAEMLYPDLPEYAGNVGGLMRENYRDAESTDIYICSGDADGEIYEPRFTFHGFRYVELNGVTNPPEITEIEALQYSSITEFDGSFTSSDSLLNRFAENVQWSQLCNFISIPTDCPQRNERMGWAGDTHVFCNTALHNSNLKLFYERNLQAFADLQEENGRYPEIAPFGGGFGGITYECAPIFIAWELYLQYGDKRTLERHYRGFVKYMDYMEGAGLPGRGKEKMLGPLADWLAFEETDAELLWNAFYYREALLMEKISAVLGREREKEKYGTLKEEVRRFWNQTFVSAESGKTCDIDGNICDTQTSYAIAIEYGVAQEVQSMGDHLARKVRENGYKVGTGFFGTGLLNRALSKTGHDREAYEMILQREFPSWLYPVTQGATTIWEHWDSYTEENGFGTYQSMNSFNHYSLGSVVSWLYDYVLGIHRLETDPGYCRFLLRPVIGKLDYAKGQIASPHGIIESGWEKSGDEMIYECAIPGNTSAELYLPDGQKLQLQSGRYRFRVKNKRGENV